LKGLNFTAIDFETANERPDSVCSMGIVLVRDGQIADKRYRLIRPPDLRFSPRNIEVHGITPEEVRHEPQFYRFWNAIRPMLEESPVIAHNAGFDIGVLQAVLERYRLDFPTLEYSCSLRMARRAWKGMPSYGLGALADYFGYRFEHHHALEDAEMCAKIVLNACDVTGTRSISELNTNLNIKAGRIIGLQHHKVQSMPQRDR